MGPPKERTIMANQILYATDFSPISEHAFTKAVEFAKLMGAGLTVAHVLHFPPMDGSPFLPQADETQDRTRTWCVHRLDEMKKKAEAAGVKAETALREGSHPHHGVSKLAEELKASMIVIGTHGRTGLSKLVVGSVAARIITEAPCPVLTVRA